MSADAVRDVPTQRRIPSTTTKDREQRVRSAAASLRQGLRGIRGIGAEYVTPIQLTDSERRVLLEIVQDLQHAVTNLPAYEGSL